MISISTLCRFLLPVLNQLAIFDKKGGGSVEEIPPVERRFSHVWKVINLIINQMLKKDQELAALVLRLEALETEVQQLKRRLNL